MIAPEEEQIQELFDTIINWEGSLLWLGFKSNQDFSSSNS